MIIQGSNVPITIEIEDKDKPVSDMSVTLSIPGKVIKHWNKSDLTSSETNIFKAPITQAESMEWETGPCLIEVKWTDEDGLILNAITEDEIVHWHDKNVLAEA